MAGGPGLENADSVPIRGCPSSPGFGDLGFRNDAGAWLRWDRRCIYDAAVRVSFQRGVPLPMIDGRAQVGLAFPVGKKRAKNPANARVMRRAEESPGSSLSFIDVVVAVVLTENVVVAALPFEGVTVDGEKLHEERLGSPEHEKLTD